MRISDGLLVPTLVAERLPEGSKEELKIDISLDGVIYNVTFRIVGTFDYFPTMPESSPLYVVGNMDYVEREIGGAFPHGIWMRLNAGADPHAILKSIELMSITPGKPVVLSDLIAEDKRNLERIGIFGLLTVCFLTGAVLSGTELLIYSYANLTGRTTRFAMLQAIGMRGREIVGIVSSEYLLVLVYGVAAGILGGVCRSAALRAVFPAYPGSIVADPALFADRRLGEHELDGHRRHAGAGRHRRRDPVQSGAAAVVPGAAAGEPGVAVSGRVKAQARDGHADVKTRRPQTF